ncbi:IclR family transcriptional regulator [Acuticoccus kandeliae]|uniref:IclR family transcriptional regulator n=1 Tax=Acuticoccus kandeliae TaxID=2073160 RepID=UPI000D3E6FAE|nr:IclR family transcriptional regulator [Acuticoccus kandeliae]
MSAPQPVLPDDAAEDGPDPRLFVSTVDRVMRVLEAFGGSRERLTIADIAKRTGLGRSAAQRLVYTLDHLGYLDRDATGRLYGVSTRLAHLSGELFGRDSLPDRVAPALECLNAATGETVTWVERRDDEIIVLKVLPSRHFTHVALSVGQRFPMLPSSSGQAILAHLPMETATALHARADARILARLSWRTRDEMVAHFAGIRAAGYAQTEKSEDIFSVSLSAPILGPGGVPLGAVNVSALRARYPDPGAEDLARQLLEATALIRC